MPTAAPHTIAKTRVAAWLQRLMERAEVVAPVRSPSGEPVFAPLDDPSEVVWEFENTLMPPKQFLLPQTDPLLTIRPENGSYRLDPVPAPAPRVLFNVRSCDVAGMAFLRRVQAADLTDTAYLQRADRTLLVSLSCPTPCRIGFCVCCDAGPFLASGFDVQLTDLGDRLLAEPGSDKGAELLGLDGARFAPASPSDLQRRAELEEDARRHFGSQTCHFASAMRRVSTGRVAETLWDTMEDWCFQCGGCNFVCPTCYCFSIKDQRDDGGWTRCRIWDSCQYTAFTLEASGHNPRPRRKDRMKRRFFHKVSAQYYLREGSVGCVGCGRCVEVCLGTTDMPAVVAAIRRGAWHG